MRCSGRTVASRSGWTRRTGCTGSVTLLSKQKHHIVKPVLTGHCIVWPSVFYRHGEYINKARLWRVDFVVGQVNF